MSVVRQWTSTYSIEKRGGLDQDMDCLSSLGIIVEISTPSSVVFSSGILIPRLIGASGTPCEYIHPSVKTIPVPIKAR